MKKHLFFISSTYEDNQEERNEISLAVLKNGHIPIGMETFAASGKNVWKTIKGYLDITDYLILLIKGRYGYVIPEEGISYTEKEYDYARKNDIPIIAFIYKGKLSDKEREKDNPDKYDRFIEQVQREVYTLKWTKKKSLGAELGSSVSEIIKKNPTRGVSSGNIHNFYENFNEQKRLSFLKSGNKFKGLYYHFEKNTIGEFWLSIETNKNISGSTDYKEHRAVLWGWKEDGISSFLDKPEMYFYGIAKIQSKNHFMSIYLSDEDNGEFIRIHSFTKLKNQKYIPIVAYGRNEISSVTFNHSILLPFNLDKNDMTPKFEAGEKDQLLLRRYLRTPGKSYRYEHIKGEPFSLRTRNMDYNPMLEDFANKTFRVWSQTYKGDIIQSKFTLADDLACILDYPMTKGKEKIESRVGAFTISNANNEGKKLCLTFYQEKGVQTINFSIIDIGLTGQQHIYGVYCSLGGKSIHTSNERFTGLRAGYMVIVEDDTDFEPEIMKLVENEEGIIDNPYMAELFAKMKFVNEITKKEDDLTVQQEPIFST